MEYGEMLTEGGALGERDAALEAEALKAIAAVQRPDEIKALQEQLILELEGYFDEKLVADGKFNELTKKYLKAHLDMGYDMGTESMTKEEAIAQFISNMEEKINTRQETIEGSIEDEVMDWIEMVD